MARTSATQVKEIFDTTLSDSELQSFITTANVVEEELAPRGVSEARMVEIEQWLAAHFAATKDQRVSQEEQGGASFSYEGSTGMGLDRTRYGQMARDIDPTGRLEEMSNGQQPYKSDNLLP